MPGVVYPSITQTANGVNLYQPSVASGTDVLPNLLVTGNAGVGGNLSVAGTTTLTSSVAVGSNLAVTGAVTCASLSSPGVVSAGTLSSVGNVNCVTVNASGAVNGASLTVSGAVSAGSVGTVGNTSSKQIVSGTPISIAGYDAISNTNFSAPVSAFRAYQPLAVPPCAAGATFESPELNTLVQANGAQVIAFSICSPYTFPDGANQQGAASAIWITDSRSGNSGGFVAPQVVAARAQGWGYTINGNGTSGNPIRVTFTTSTQTDAGVLTITKIC